MAVENMRTCVLPGLEKTDAMCFDSTCGDGDTCVLTMESVVLGDTSATAQMYVKQEQLPEGKREEMLTEAKALPQLKPIRIKACSHVFSAMELLVLVSTRGFRCPVCRHGSGREVQLEHAMGHFRDFPREVWRFLCELASVTRARLKLESEREAEHEMAELRVHELNVVRQLPALTLAQLCSFELTVAAYVTNMTTGRNAPNIPKMVYRIPMRLVDSARSSSDSVLESEAGRCRMLSRFLSKARWYTARVDLQIDGVDDEEFPLVVGGPMCCVHHRMHAGRPTSLIDEFSGATQHGTLRITHQPCLYSGEHMVSRVCYSIDKDSFRTLVASVLSQTFGTGFP